MDLKCYNCGLEGSPKTFLIERQVHSSQKPDNDRGRVPGWWCNQCCFNPARIGYKWSYTDRPSPWKNPKWNLVETSEGLYIQVGNVLSPMVGNHQIADAPASILHEGLEGTIREYSALLRASGRAQSNLFHKDIEDWKASHPEPARRFSHDWVDWREALIAATDEFRKARRVGPHSERVTHDGWKVQSAAEAALYQARKAS